LSAISESTQLTGPDVSPQLGALLASLTEQVPSNDAAAVIEAALAARPTTPLQSPPTDDEVAAFGRAVDDVQHTLSLVAVEHWDRPAVNGLRVGELVGHLIGTQIAMAAELGLSEPIGASRDHIETTRASIVAGAALSPAEAAAEFARTSAVVTAHLAHLDSRGLASPARFGTLTVDVRFLLVGRVFELWTHDNDLRTAIGVERVEPDADRLWMMTRAVMPLVRLIGGERLRIVLTGAGGGVWPAASGEIAEIAVDSVAFCRRVANRLSIDDLEADISGDSAAANDTLNALAALALD
jgi:uncharacterized protein (TIGR03083 family)